MSSVNAGDTRAWILRVTPFTPGVSVVVPVTGMHSPLAATRSVCLFLNSSSLCCTAIFLFIILLVQPVFGVAVMWNATPVFPCAIQRSKGGMLDADLAALAYSGSVFWQWFPGFLRLCLLCAWHCSGKVLFFLSISILLAILALAHFCHVSLFVALGTRHLFPFNFADILFVWAAVPVACDWCVAPAARVAGRFRLLDPLLFLG